MILFLATLRLLASSTDSTNYYSQLYTENKTWDWTDPDAYPEYFYISGEQPIPCVFPFADANLGVIVEKNDYLPDDGWVLLYKDFGSENFAVKMPYMVLYHKYTGIMRVYIFLVCPESYTKISIRTYFEMNGSANLSFAVSPSYALDKENKYISNTIIGYTQGSNGHWVYQDIPIAYDPSIKNLEHVSFIFDTWGIINTNIEIDGKIQLSQKNIANLGQTSKNLPKIIDGAGKSLAEKYKSWNEAKTSTINAFNKTASFFHNLGKTNISDALTDLSNLVSNLPFGPLGALYGLYSFFTAGGKKNDPIPYYFEGNVKLNGTMETDLFIGKLKMRVPGSISPTYDYWRPVYDKPLGVINLLETPTVKKLYYFQYDKYNLVMWTSYKLSSDIQYLINPEIENINIEEIKANLFCSFNYPDNITHPPEDLLQDWDDKGFISLESGKTRIKDDNTTEAILNYSTGFLDLSKLVGYFINTPQKNINLKLYVRLRRTDVSDTEPIVLTPVFKLNILNSENEFKGPWNFYLKAKVNGTNVNLEWARLFLDEIYNQDGRTLYIQKSSDGINWSNIYSTYNPSSSFTTYSVTPHLSDGQYVFYRINLRDIYGMNVFSQVKKINNPNYFLSVNITGPNNLNSGQSGTYTAHPSGGSGSYTNYEWWERRDDDVPMVPMGNNGILAPPSNQWVYLTSGPDKQQITISRTYSFSLKCSVTDSYNDQATSNILSVHVSGGAMAKQNANQSPAIAIQVPKEVELQSNFPNPFNPTTSIKFGLPQDDYVRLTVFSMNGQKVKTLIKGQVPKGYHRVVWDGTNESGQPVSGGLYIYELKTGNKRILKKMLLVK